MEKPGITGGIMFEGERVAVPIVEAFTKARDVLEDKTIPLEEFGANGNPIYSPENIAVIRKLENETQEKIRASNESLHPEDQDVIRNMEMYATVLESVFCTHPKWFGEPMLDGTEVMPTVLIDDLKNGADMIVSRKKQNGEIAVSAMDITFGGEAVVRKKVGRLINRFKKGTPPGIFFFKRDDFAGEVSSVPLFIVGTDFRHMKNLLYSSVQGNTEATRSDPIQIEIVEDIIYQGQIYIDVLQKSVESHTEQKSDGKIIKSLQRALSNYKEAISFYEKLLKLRKAMREQGSIVSSEESTRFRGHLHTVLESLNS